MTEKELAADVAQTVQRIYSIIQALQERHPEVINLNIHLAYGWQVATLLKEAEEAKE